MGFKVTTPLSFKGIITEESYLFIENAAYNKKTGCLQLEVRPYHNQQSRNYNISNFAEFGERRVTKSRLKEGGEEGEMEDYEVQLPGFKTWYIIPVNKSDVENHPIGKVAYTYLKKEIIETMEVSIEDIL